MKAFLISALFLGGQAQAATGLDDLIRDFNRKGAQPAPAAEAPAPLSPTVAAPAEPDAWGRLLEGNGRFVRGLSQHPHLGVKRRQALAKAQQPGTIVLACADSRVAPELVFDQGLGDLFVVRVAGNVAGPFDRASIEYAVEHLHSRLLVVLGHERCGAVKASQAVALDPKSAAGLSPDLRALVKEIEPSIQGRQGEEGLDLAVRDNARRSAQRLLEQSPALQAAVKSGELKVVCARLDLDSGRVEPLD